MSLFNTDSDQNQPAGTEPNSSDALTTILASIKNEKGEPKYASVEEALKGLQHAQEFISTLKGEKQTLEAEVNARKSVEEALKGLSTMDTPEGTPPPAYNPDDIKTLVDQQLQAYKAANVESENLSKCEASLKAKYGDKAQTVIKETAEKLGRSPQELETLAAKDPALFLGLFSGDLKRDTTPMAGNGFNTHGFQQSPESTIKRNSESLWNGGNLKDEFHASRKMVEELHNQGSDTYSLTDPKKYFALFGKK